MRGSIAVVLAAAATQAVAQDKPPQDDACAPLHFVYARATTEPPTGVENATPEQFEAAANKGWSKGFGAAGFSMLGNISAVIPGTTGYPVHYPASWTGCTSENKGIADLLAQLSKQSKACPNQKFVLGGHSQGGVVTTRAIAQIPANILAKVVAVTMVGSPNCPEAVKGRCKSFCNKGDGICAANAQSAGRCNADGSTAPKAGSPKGGAPKSGGSAGEVNVRMEGSMPPPGTYAHSGRKPDCSKPEVAEKDYEGKFTEGAHLSYNKEGHFMEAAACYVLGKWKANGGAV